MVRLKKIIPFPFLFLVMALSVFHTLYAEHITADWEINEQIRNTTKEYTFVVGNDVSTTVGNFALTLSYMAHSQSMTNYHQNRVITKIWKYDQLITEKTDSYNSESKEGTPIPGYVHTWTFNNLPIIPQDELRLTVEVWDGDWKNYISQINVTTSWNDTGTNDGLVAYYQFNGNANDESGKGNHGIVYGATLTKDRFGNANSAYNFDGVNDTIVVPDSNNDFLELIGDFSISFFILGNMFSSQHQWLIFSKHRCCICKPNDTSWMLRYDVVSDQFYISNNDTSFLCGTDFRDTSKTSINDDEQWHHVVVTYQKSPKILKYFIDGREVSNLIANINIKKNSQPFIIGNQNGGNSDGALDGIIDDIRIYNRAISNSEVQQLYQPGSASAPVLANLVNISTRAPILGGTNNVIAGFIIEGTGTQPIVLRGWGLETSVDPMLTLQKQVNNQWSVVAGNNNWQKGARYTDIPSQMTNSFEADDAALLLDLAEGVYTLNLSSVGKTGRGLVGVDAIDSNQNIKLINISTRAPIKGGADNVVAGFIIEGTGTQKIVLRGWGLDDGVDPKLTLQKQITNTQWEIIASNDNWQTDSHHAEIPNYMTASFEANDAALLRDLQAGVYTVTLSSVGAYGLGLVGVDAIY